jgi:hypothetical protein
MAVQKYFPMQGTKKFATTSRPIVRAFRVDFENGTVTGVKTLSHFTKGCQILGFQCKVNTAFTSVGSATIQAGFSVTTSGSMSSSAIGMSTLVADYIFGASSTYTKAPYLLASADNFDLDVGTTTIRTGQLDVHVTYIPPPDGNIPDGDVFESFDVT